MITFDLVTVFYFIIILPIHTSPALRLVDICIAAVILVDFICRLWLSKNRVSHLVQIYVISDIVVLASLILNPFIGIDLSFLRVLRGLRLAYSEYLLQDLRRDFAFFRLREHIFVAFLNMLIFLFFVAAAVFTFSEEAQGVDGYINAIYFTVATLTTTGFGDITPTTNTGKIITVFIMIVGVTLFVNLARAIFTPLKVNYTCKTCGLSRHDPDAVHCKHCGTIVNIKTKGAE
ncbi:MAG: ion channel [Pseudomonadota bacterium]